jgi:hypothetical protein
MTSSGVLGRVALVRISSQRASVASYGYVPSSPIVVTVMKEALSYTETSVLTRATRRNNTENAILHFFKCFMKFPHEPVQANCIIPYVLMVTFTEASKIYCYCFCA